MISTVPPAAIFILGALLVPFFKGIGKKAFLVTIPLLGFINLSAMPMGTDWILRFLDFELVLVRLDGLSFPFAVIFHLIALIAVIYSLHVDDDVQHMAGLVYAGSSLGVVFARDLFTFFVFWEMLTVSSVFLIWSRKVQASREAGFRYFLVHAAGGLCLLAGIVLHVKATGRMEFTHIGLNGLGSYLIFLGIGVNCAWPLLHPWLTDAYPEATVTGAVFLSAFTTKVAVYALARSFAGTHILIWIGAAMTAFPIFYAVIENDLRRVLSYSLINQVGYMVCGIGIGTQLALNGTVSHAFCHILYKALLFMSVGAVLHQTGKSRCTDLGGLYKTMPLTCIFCMVGAASISAFPFFSGFICKSMIVDSAAVGHMPLIWLVLLFASAGVFHHSGIKIPFFAFFSHDSGLRPEEPPKNMLIAMGAAAFFCVFLGCFPQPLYAILPYPVDFEPYTFAHVLSQSQLLFFSALAFTLLLLSGVYPPEMRAVNLDADWLYRKGGWYFYLAADKGLNFLNLLCDLIFVKGIAAWLSWFGRRGMEKISLAVLLPIWERSGIGQGEIQFRKKTYHRAFLAGTSSAGISAAGAALFIIILVLFS